MGSQYIDSMTLCLVCQRWQNHTLCEDCIHTFAQPKLRCRRCALPLLPTDQALHASATHTVCCDDCVDTPPPLDACIAAVDYDFPWSACLTRFKFNQDVGLAPALARLMRHTPWAEPAIDAADRIMPMPLSAERLQERGFHQTLELARHLDARKLDHHSLQRLDTAQHQVGADREQRWQQAQDSFWVQPDALAQLAGLRVVLIDDVMTTGATLYAAAQTLRRAGVVHLTALVLARTPPPSRIVDNAAHVPYRAGPP